MDGETSETRRMLFQNEINLRYCASIWFTIEIEEMDVWNNFEYCWSILYFEESDIGYNDTK
jgi:hypothetical protein